MSNESQDPHGQRFEHWLDLISEGHREKANRLLAEASGEDKAQLQARIADYNDTLALLSSAGQQGRVIGGYALTSEVGRGSVGIVWRARRLSDSKPVAIKVLAWQHSLSPNGRARFLREARVLENLNHPGIVRLLDSGQEDGLFYLVTELVDPPITLEHELQCLRELEQFPAGHDRQVAHLFLRICQALEFAHRQGVLHRDIKPANILIQSDGTPILTDFSLARGEGEIGLTSTGQVIGTPKYMSPEHVGAKLIDIDRRSDLFSVGICLYESLTLRPPFDGRSRNEVCRKIMIGDPKSPRRYRRDLSPLLAEITMKAIEHSPEHRYPTAAALAADLEGYLEGSKLGARRVARRWIEGKRRRFPQSFTALTVGIPFLAALLYFVRDRAQANERVHASDTRALHAADEGRWDRYARTVANSVTSLEVGDWSSARNALSSTERSERGWEWGYLTISANNTTTKRQGHDDRITSMVARPQGIVSTGRDGVLQLRNGSNDERKVLLRHRLPLLCADQSADRILACDTEGTLLLWNSRVEPIASITEAKAVACGLLSAEKVWSATVTGQTTLWNTHNGLTEARRLELVSPIQSDPSGTLIASSTLRHTVQIRDLDGEVLMEFDPGFSAIRSLAWSADSERLAALGLEGTIVVWEVERKAAWTRIEGLHAKAVALSPDGNILAFADEKEAVHLIDIEVPSIGFQDADYLLGADASVSHLAFSADGEHIYAACRSGNILQWLSVPSEAKVIKKVSPTPLRSVRVSPNGDWMATGSMDGEVRVFDGQTSELRASLDIHRGAVKQLSFSRDWPYLASSDANGTIQILDLSELQVKHTLAVGQPIAALEIAPDGRQLAWATRAGVAHLVDLTEEADSRVLTTTQRTIADLRYSTDGTDLIAMTVDDWGHTQKGGWSLDWWNVEQHAWRGAVHFQGPPPTAFTLSSLGQVAVAADREIHLLDGQRGVVLGTLQESERIVDLCFDQQGQRLFVGKPTGVSIWCPQRRTFLMHLRQGSEELTALAFCSSYSRVLGAFESGQLGIWSSSSLDTTPLWQEGDRHRRLSERVERLLSLQFRAGRVQRALETEVGLGPEDLAWCLRHAEALGDLSAPRLNTMAWNLVVSPKASAHESLRGLEAARRAVALAPRDRHCLHTLGLAQYRNHQFGEALKTLGLADEQDRASFLGRSRTATLALQSLCHLALDNRDKALEIFNMALAASSADGNPSAKRLLAEAQDAILSSNSEYGEPLQGK